MWANCLRHLPDEGITVAELHDRARTGTNLDGMRRWGYVTVTPDPGRGSHLPGGRPWQEVTAQVESRWQGRLGAGAFAALRAALAGVAAQLDPALPDCLPILGYGLFSRPIPAGRASGTKPVPGPATLVRGRPAAVGAAVPHAARLRRTVRGGARPVPWRQRQRAARAGRRGHAYRRIPALSGVSKESVAMAAGWLRAAGLVTEGPDPAGGRRKFTTFTPRGVIARDEYPARAAAVEGDWRACFGAAAVSSLRGSVAPLLTGDPPPLAVGLAPYQGNWRARRPPPATLPHYPMTLHRGGYPDGS